MNTFTFCIRALKVLVCRCINPLRTRNPITGILANIEDPDEMLQTAAFHLGLHCLLRLKQSLEKEI